MRSYLGIGECFPSALPPPEVLPPFTRPSGLTVRWRQPRNSPPVKTFTVSWRAESWWAAQSRTVPATARDIQELHIVGIKPGETVRVWVYASSTTASSPYGEVKDFVLAEDLFTAVFAGDIVKCKELLSADKAKKAEQLAGRDIDNNTLAHWAVLNAHTAVVKWLAEEGAPMNVAVEPDNMRPIHWLCVQSRLPHERPSEVSLLECLKILLEYGADINSTTRKFRTPLVLAVQSNLPEIAEFLIECGTDVAVADNMGDNVIHWCAYHGRIDILDRVHQQGLTLTAQDAVGQTALHIAAQRAQVPTVQYLMDRGGLALVDIKDNNGKTALQLAQSKGLHGVVAVMRSRREAMVAKGDDSHEMAKKGDGAQGEEAEAAEAEGALEPVEGPNNGEEGGGEKEEGEEGEGDKGGDEGGDKDQGGERDEEAPQEDKDGKEDKEDKEGQ